MNEITVELQPREIGERLFLKAIKGVVSGIGQGAFGVLTWDDLQSLWHVRDLLVHGFNQIGPESDIVVAGATFTVKNADTLDVHFPAYCKISSYEKRIITKVLP